MDAIFNSIRKCSDFSIRLASGDTQTLIKFSNKANIVHIIEDGRPGEWGIAAIVLNNTVDEYQHLNDDTLYDFIAYVYTAHHILRIVINSQVKMICRNAHPFGSTFSAATHIFASKNNIVVANPTMSYDGRYRVQVEYFDLAIEKNIYSMDLPGSKHVKFFQSEYGEVYYGYKLLESSKKITMQMISMPEMPIFSAPSTLIHCNEFYLLAQINAHTFQLTARNSTQVREFTKVRHVLFTVFGMLVVDLEGAVLLYDVSDSTDIKKLGKLVKNVGNIYRPAYNVYTADIKKSSVNYLL